MAQRESTKWRGDPDRPFPIGLQRRSTPATIVDVLETEYPAAFTIDQIVAHVASIKQRPVDPRTIRRAIYRLAAANVLEHGPPVEIRRPVGSWTDNSAQVCTNATYRLKWEGP